VAHHNSDLWRQSSPVGAGSGNPVWANWALAGPWLCQHLWEHYAFSGDRAFLRDRAYPLMRGAAEFCLDWLILDRDGFLVTCPSTSPENRFRTTDGQTASVSAGASMDLEIIWDLFTHCLEAGELLATDQEFRERLTAARSRLRPLQIGQHGQLQGLERRLRGAGAGASPHVAPVRAASWSPDHAARHAGVGPRSAHLP